MIWKKLRQMTLIIKITMKPQVLLSRIQVYVCEHFARVTKIMSRDFAFLPLM